MKTGWFDLFRTNGGPAFYPESNRTTVIADFSAITVYFVFGTLLLAFFIVMPGIRQRRLTIFTSVVFSLFVGGSCLVGIFACGWHTAEAEISTAYRAFSDSRIHGHIGVYVGLGQINVTFKAKPMVDNHTMDVDFNERLNFLTPTQVREDYHNALQKGLPYPILTVAEYMSVDSEGFVWGRDYRQAGYYTAVVLWTAFALWILMIITFFMVPTFGAYLMSITGGLMITSNLVYFCLIPTHDLKIHFESAILEFDLGWCFWLVFVAGSLSFIVGVTLSVVEYLYPNKFSLVLEVDYGHSIASEAVTNNNNNNHSSIIVANVRGDSFS